jgi:hypothetical protein
MQTIRFLVFMAYAYMLLGVLFAFFVWRGAEKLDDAARGISWKVRALLFPGSVALWPVLLRQWRRAAIRPAQFDPEAD